MCIVQVYWEVLYATVSTVYCTGLSESTVHYCVNCILYRFIGKYGKIEMNEESDTNPAAEFKDFGVLLE